VYDCTKGRKGTGEKRPAQYRKKTIRRYHVASPRGRTAVVHLKERGGSFHSFFRRIQDTWEGWGKREFSPAVFRETHRRQPINKGKGRVNKSILFPAGRGGGMGDCLCRRGQAVELDFAIGGGIRPLSYLNRKKRELPSLAGARLERSKFDPKGGGAEGVFLAQEINLHAVKGFWEETCPMFITLLALNILWTKRGGGSEKGQFEYYGWEKDQVWREEGCMES